MHSTSALPKRSQKQEDSPRGTRPIGRTTMVRTLSPRFSSVVSFHKLLGIFQVREPILSMRWGHVYFHTLLLLVVAHTVEVVSEIRGSPLLRRC